MRRVAPSALVREEIDRLLSGGVERGGNIVSELASLGLRYLAQQALEQEQQDHLGRDATSAAAGTNGRDGETATRTPSSARLRGPWPCAYPRSGSLRSRTAPS